MGLTVSTLKQTPTISKKPQAKNSSQPFSLTKKLFAAACGVLQFSSTGLVLSSQLPRASANGIRVSDYNNVIDFEKHCAETTTTLAEKNECIGKTLFRNPIIAPHINKKEWAEYRSYAEEPSIEGKLIPQDMKVIFAIKLPHGKDGLTKVNTYHVFKLRNYNTYSELEILTVNKKGEEIVPRKKEKITSSYTINKGEKPITFKRDAIFKTVRLMWPDGLNTSPQAKKALEEYASRAAKLAEKLGYPMDTDEYPTHPTHNTVAQQDTVDLANGVYIENRLYSRDDL